MRRYHSEKRNFFASIYPKIENFLPTVGKFGNIGVVSLHAQTTGTAIRTAAFTAIQYLRLWTRFEVSLDH